MGKDLGKEVSGSDGRSVTVCNLEVVQRLVTVGGVHMAEQDEVFEWKSICADGFICLRHLIRTLSEHSVDLVYF